MSIKGIDTQIMIARLSDNIRDASAMHKKPEVAQDTLAHARKINDAQDQTKVAKTTESEMENIRTDVDESGGGAYSGESGSKRNRDGQNDEPGEDLTVPPGNNIIDITV